MSQAARSALINIGTRRQGATLRGSQGAVTELQYLGYIGTKGGLTRKGSAARERIMDEEMSW